MVRRNHADRREHRAGAGHEDEPERHAEQEAAAAGPQAGQPRKRPLDEQPELRHDQDRRDEEQQRDREVVEQIVGKPELAEQPGRRQREHDEAADKPDDDPKRLAP